MAEKLLLTALIIIVLSVVIPIVKIIIDARKANNKANTSINSVRHLTDREYRSEMAEKDAQNLRDAEDDKR